MIPDGINTIFVTNPMLTNPMLYLKCPFVIAVLRLSGREPRRVPPVGDDVRQLSQAPRLLHHRHHARQAPRGEFLKHT